MLKVSLEQPGTLHEESIPRHCFALQIKTAGGESTYAYPYHSSESLSRSTGDFLSHKHHLPPEVQLKVASVLVRAWNSYSVIPPVPLQKVASGGYEVTPDRFPSNIAKDDFKSSWEEWLSNDPETPDSNYVAEQTARMKKKSGQTAEMGSELYSYTPGFGGDSDDEETIKESQVSISEDILPDLNQEKRASVTLSSSLGDMDLDTPKEVLSAQNLFEKSAHLLEVQDRRRVGLTLAHRANTLGVETLSKTASYGGVEYGDHIHDELEARISMYQGTEHERGYKLAHEVIWNRSLPANEASEYLFVLDKTSGASRQWGKRYRDPYLAVHEKVASVEEPTGFSWQEGSTVITDSDLSRLAIKGYQKIDAAYGIDFRRDFQRDPVATFSSLPDPEKKELARMASAVEGEVLAI